MTKNRLIKLIYKAAQEYKGKLIDKSWENVYALMNRIADFTGASVNLGGGAYCQSFDGLSHWKEYTIEIHKDNLTVKGLLTAHAGGSLDDPFSSYDLTIQLW